MKKGFTMIELIFVIVILGILASVAIPRIAGTREDAEVSAGIANIRTILSDAASYYAVKGNFNDATGTASAKWRDITNVPLRGAAPTGADIGPAIDATADAVGGQTFLAVGGKNCLQVGLRYSSTTLGGYIALKPVDTNKNNGACKTFLATDSIKQLLNSTLPTSVDKFCTGANNGGMSCVLINSGSIYK